MKWTLVNLLLFLIAVQGSYDHRDLKCLVCVNVVNEMEAQLSKIRPSQTISVGGYRLDNSGTLKQKTVPLAQSELYLSGVLDDICKKMDDYARAVHKTTKQLTLLKLIMDDGKLNPEMSEVDLIQDSDLNKSLRFYCEGIVDEFEDDFIRVFKEETEERDVKICAEAADFCMIVEGQTLETMRREEL